MKNSFIVLYLCLFLSVGCVSPKVIKTQDIGQTVDAEILMSSTKIITTKRTITVKGHKPVFTGKQCAIVEYDNKQTFLCVDGEAFCWEIIKGR